MNKQNNRIARMVWLTTLLFALIFCFTSCGQAQTTVDFTCHIVDSHGQKIHGYDSGDGRLWYLFVPSTEDVSSLTLFVSDNVSKVSSGELDSATSTVIDAFKESDELKLTCDGTKIQVAIKQSDLPSLHIVLTDTTLDEVHKDKDEKYKGNSVYLSDPAGEYDLTVEGSVEMKGRGNSSWQLFDKKGYQIKFDEKTSIMGMGKAKKWVLLANASDDSMMRTQLTYQMASQLNMAFVPSFEYIDLWINGDYRGTYIIGEKVELGGSRLDLGNSMGVLFEHDEGFWQEEDHWFLSTYLERHFVLKESVEEDDETVILVAMDDFAAAVDELAKYLYSTNPEDATLDELSTMIDVDSFIDYYLANEYTQNRESFATSFYWYKDGPEDVIHLGPIWDFDTCMGNDGTEYSESYGEQHILFRHLLAIPEFRQLVLERARSYMPLFAEMDSSAEALYDEIKTSAEMNYLRWDVLGKPNPKGGEDFYETYDKAVSTLKTWLASREEAFTIPEVAVVTSVVSEDCSEMVIRYQDKQSQKNVRFAVWSIADGQDDLVWYNAQEDTDGSWYVVVDLKAHNSTGIYRYDVYHDGCTDAAAATGRNYVETAQTS